MQGKHDKTIEDVLPYKKLDDEAMREIFSDHLPKLTTVPISADQSINILSYNTLSTWAFQGFDRSSETSAEETDRHQRISTFISNLAQLSNLGLISLQETAQELAQQIKDALGEDWFLVRSDGNRAILYHKLQFSLIDDTIAPTKIDKRSQIYNDDFLGVLLKHNATNKTIAAFSAHVPHDESPVTAERAIRVTCDEFSRQADLILFAADFNRRVAHTGAGLVDNANNLIPKGFRTEQKIYDFTDGCFVYDTLSKELTQYDSLTPCQSSPEKTIQRRSEHGEQVYPDDPNYYPVMFSVNHLLPVTGATGKSLSVQDLETSLRNKTKQNEQELHIDVYATRFNKKKLLIHSIKEIPELEALGLVRSNGAYELKFNYDTASLKESDVIGLNIDTPQTGNQTISLTSLSPSPSLALKICSGVLAALGGAALIVGALAIATVVTAIAPPVGIAMVVVGAVALISGIGFFIKSMSKKDTFLDNSLKEDLSLSIE